MSGYRMGVDVSQWQGNIDWEKAKAAGIEFAMLRAGFGQNSVDPQFKRNITECNRLGIPCGVYWFSYAYTADMANREAQCVLKTVEPYRLEYPIAFDFEGDSADYALKKGVTVTRTLVSAFARAFCGEIAAGKYSPMVYTNPDYLSRYYDAEIPKEFDIWAGPVADETGPGLQTRPGGRHMAVYELRLGGRHHWPRGQKRELCGLSPSCARKGPATTWRRRFRGCSPRRCRNENDRARAWPWEKGITDGENPDSPATRQQVWTMLYRMNGGK